MWEWLALVAIFDSGRRERRQGGGAGVGSASATTNFRISQSALGLGQFKRHSRYEWGDTHGPTSDGVSDGGGGRLISVGVVIVKEDVWVCEQCQLNLTDMVETTGIRESVADW